MVQTCKESSKENGGKTPVYFSMNVPDWFMNIPVEKKCQVVEDLALKLRGQGPISDSEMDELFKTKR